MNIQMKVLRGLYAVALLTLVIGPAPVLADSQASSQAGTEAASQAPIAGGRRRYWARERQAQVRQANMQNRQTQQKTLQHEHKVAQYRTKEDARASNLSREDVLQTHAPLPRRRWAR